MKHWPNIIELLGSDPNPIPTTLGEKILAYRRAKGISRKRLAEKLRVDEGTLWKWEIGKRKPNTKLHIATVEKLLSII